MQYHKSCCKIKEESVTKRMPVFSRLQSSYLRDQKGVKPYFNVTVFILEGR